MADKEGLSALLRIGFSKNYSGDVDPLFYDSRMSPRREMLAKRITDVITKQCHSNDGKRPRILELASGTGIITSELSKQFDVTRFDLSLPMLEVSRQKSSHIPVVQGDMNAHLPFASDAFDAVTIVWGNRYINNEWLCSFTNEVNRVLRPDGVFVWPIFPVESLLWGKIGSRLFPEQVRKEIKEAHFSEFSIIHPPLVEKGQPPFHAPGFLLARK